MIKERKTELSVMTVLLCFMVIFIHTASIPIMKLSAFSWQHIAIYIPWKLGSVAVYGFLFLSGVKLFLQGTASFSAGKFYRRRFGKILIPYVIWIIIYYLYYVDQEYYAFHIKDLLNYLLTGEVASHFYFIVILVQLYALMPLWVKLYTKIPAKIMIPAAAVITLICYYYLPIWLSFFGVENFIYNDRIFTSYFFFWTAGCYVGLHYNAFYAFLRRQKTAIFAIFIAFAVLETTVFYLPLVENTFFGYDAVLHLSYCATAILFLLLISKKLASCKFASSPGFQRLDRATFSIYLSHILIMNIVDFHIAEQGIWQIDIAFFWRFLFTYFISVVGCVLFVFIKEKIQNRSSCRCH